MAESKLGQWRSVKDGEGTASAPLSLVQHAAFYCPEVMALRGIAWGRNYGQIYQQLGRAAMNEWAQDQDP